jgi:hypothetical protein
MRQLSPIAACSFVLLSFLLFGPAFSSEVKLRGQGGVYSTTQMTLGCRDGKVYLEFEWSLPIGKPGLRRRHIFLPGSLGDSHVWLKVLQGGTRTGAASDLEARELIQQISENVTGDVISVGVFPAGRDEAIGDWEFAEYGRAGFLKAMQQIAGECKWDVKKPLQGALKISAPGYDIDGN